jgi:cephalosporin hydroxylase
MSGEREFARALADYLALHTEQSAELLSELIHAFLRGAPEFPKLDAAAKDGLNAALHADMESYNNVPTFLQNYLLTHLQHGQWPPQAAFLARRYLGRSAGQRFMSWEQRQKFVRPLNGEPIRETELGYRQMLYSQGAGAVFHWRGFPCFKSNYDLAIYAMLVDEVRPASIVELGAGAGGSSLFFADLCQAMGLKTKITAVDTTVAQVSDPRIEFVQSDCVDWLAVLAANANPELVRPVLLIEDFHADLGGFFANIDRVLAGGDYLVIEDSYSKQNSISSMIARSPYLVDTKYTDFFGVNCTSAVNSIFVKQKQT